MSFKSYARDFLFGALNMAIFAGVCAAGYLAVRFAAYPLFHKGGNEIVAQAQTLVSFAAFVAAAAFVFIACEKKPRGGAPNGGFSGFGRIWFSIRVYACKLALCAALASPALAAFYFGGGRAAFVIAGGVCFAAYYCLSVISSPLIYMGERGFAKGCAAAAAAVIRRGFFKVFAARCMFALFKLSVFAVLSGAASLALDPPAAVTAYAGIIGIGAGAADGVFAASIAFSAMFALRPALKPFDANIRRWVISGNGLSPVFPYFYDAAAIYVLTFAAVYAGLNVAAGTGVPLPAVTVCAGAASAGVSALIIGGFKVFGGKTAGQVIYRSICSIY